MEPEEPIYVEQTSVGCDGGGGPLGHPKVYLKIDPASGKDAETVCPYCSRRYVLAEGQASSIGH